MKLITHRYYLAIENDRMMMPVRALSLEERTDLLQTYLVL